MKKKGTFRRYFAMAAIVLLMLSICAAALAESYSAGVMRLLNYEGEVHILDAAGNSRFIMENVRFNSGESLNTGAGAMASVGLDAAKILTLDSMTQVTFTKESNRMTLALASGRLLLDVQEKLDENESFDIQTSTMTVGIRGTIVYLTSFDGSEEEINRQLLESNESFRELLNRTLPTDYTGNFSQLVVLEGTAVASYEDELGQKQSVSVHAGEKITVLDNMRDQAAVTPAGSADLGTDMVNFIQSNPILAEKVEEASDILNAETAIQETETVIVEEEKKKNVPISSGEPAEHVHVFSGTYIPATCTAQGEIVYTCDCGETFSTVDDEAALGHDWGEWSVTIAPTTETEGQEKRQCARCGATETNPIARLDPTPAPHAHAPMEAVYENEIAASCEEAGSREAVVYCGTCGEEISRASETIPALGHDWGEWEVVTAADCTTEGKIKRNCQRCGEIQQETTAANGHTLVTEEAIPATCTESGWTAHIYCSVCETVMEPYQTEIPPLGHDWGEWETVENATCGVEGLKRRACRREGCGAEEEQSIPATGAHVTPEEPTIENYVEGSCTKGESFDEVLYCTVCGAEVSRTPVSADAPGHVWGPWEVVTAAGCTTEGKIKRNCQRCGEIQQETTAANGHTLVTEEAIPATCTESGWTAHIYCSVCETVMEPYRTEIPPLGHDWGEWKIVAEPDCIHEGQRQRVCSRCEQTESEILPAKGHTPIPAGYGESTVCAVCGATIDPSTSAPDT